MVINIGILTPFFNLIFHTIGRKGEPLREGPNGDLLEPQDEQMCLKSFGLADSEFDQPLVRPARTLGRLPTNSATLAV